MSLGLHLVSSEEAELSPEDIFAVAAHFSTASIPNLEKSAKKFGVTPERMKYTLFVKDYSNPGLIRIRAGNTLFTIVPMPKRAGLVRAYNADVAPRFADNMEEFFHSARKMGFDYLIVPVTKEGKLLVKRLSKRNTDKEVKVMLNPSGTVFWIKTGSLRD